LIWCFAPPHQINMHLIKVARCTLQIVRIENRDLSNTIPTCSRFFSSTKNYAMPAEKLLKESSEKWKYDWCIHVYITGNEWAIRFTRPQIKQNLLG
jgi:hypothetical protein